MHKVKIYRDDLNRFILYGNPDVYLQLASIERHKSYHINSGNSWENIGLFFGYPKCCIDHMVKHGGFFGMPEDFKQQYRQNIFCGFGYIPCPEHLKMDYEDIVDLINSKRNPFIPKIEVIHRYNLPFVYSKAR